MDEKRGLVKVYWQHVRDKVAKVEPKFASIVDALSPGASFPLYLAYYPYGAIDADTQSSLFPNQKSGYYRLTDKDAPLDVVKDLGYSANNTPLGMVLEKQIESYIDLYNEKITIPWLIYTPGKLFPFTRILSKKSNRIYSPNGLLASTAGARSTFILPSIGCATSHINLQRDFNIQHPTAKSLYEHWYVFKEIINSEIIQSDWRCVLLYFSENWVNKILHDKSWSDLKQYSHEAAWHQFEYEINRIQYDIIFSMIQKKRNLKPNPYITDTAKHLFSTAIGAAPGYQPAINDEALPANLLQKIFIESYGLKKYIPTIMHAAHYNFEKATLPIYYSLQNPSTHVFSPKSREASGTLFEMRELEYIMKIFINELSNENGMCTDTIIGHVAKSAKFNYFHNKIDRHKVVKSTSDIVNLDPRFLEYPSQYKNNGARFASDAPFVRGCISISTN